MESEVGLFVTYTGREQYVLSGIYLNLIFRIKEDTERGDGYHPPPNALYNFTNVICLSLIALLNPICASK